MATVVKTLFICSFHGLAVMTVGLGQNIWKPNLMSFWSFTLFRKHRAGVDIHSCSQFLLELYSQWILPGSPSSRKTPVVLVSEVVRSVSI